MVGGVNHSGTDHEVIGAHRCPQLLVTSTPSMFNPGSTHVQQRLGGSTDGSLVDIQQHMHYLLRARYIDLVNIEIPR